MDLLVNLPFIELVHHLEVHIGRAEHVLVHQIQGSVGDELVEMSVIVLAEFLARSAELHLEHGVVAVTHDHKVVLIRHHAHIE